MLDVRPVLRMSSCIGQASEATTHVRRQTRQSSYDSTRAVLAMDVNMLNTIIQYFTVLPTGLQFD